MTNPLLSPFDNKFNSAPFDKIKNEHFLPALKEAILEAKGSIEKIKSNPENPTFNNVILALEESGKNVGTIASVFFNLHSANTNEEQQEIAKEFSPLLTEYSNDVALDEELFSKIKTVYESSKKESMDIEDWTLLDKSYKSFSRNGALLDSKGKDKLRSIDQESSKLKLLFGDHVLKDTNDYMMVLEKEDDLKGLPESAVEAAFETAKEKGKEGKWVFTLDYASYLPMITYSEVRELRKEITLAFSQRAFKGGETDNREIIKKIANLRHERANLLGYKTHSNFVLEERMAKTPEKVYEFLDEILKKAKPMAEAEMKELQEYSTKNGGPSKLEKWDYMFWAEKLKKERFSIDDELLRPYFSLEKVIDGVFQVAKKLYGLTYTRSKDIPVYHEDVMAYEVTNEKDGHVGLFYADFFPRAGKKNGAWMTSFREQKNIEGKFQTPQISIVCSFTKPTPTKPSLLSFNEVTTLFHEFGHSLHGMLSNTKYESLSGTNVFWDFVELPSQILENWAYEKECLDLFAEHYETKEKIPEDLVKKIKESSSFHEARHTLRQVSLGLLDLAWHNQNPEGIDDVEMFENEATASAELMPTIPGTNVSCSFGHIFAGGYSSGYYSYKWAEVLDADAFEYFKEKGIFNKEVADSFKDNILSKGGSQHPMDLYLKFRGKEPSSEALLRRGGLIK